MDVALWPRITDLFHEALKLPEEEWAAFVEAASGGDAEIRREVLTMLNADRSGVSRLGRGVAEVVDQVLGDLRAVPPFVPPAKIGPYEPKEFLGRGGMGAVWKAVRLDTGRAMAIKFLLPMGEFSEDRRRRFADEIATLARLRHPHIVSFHDAGALEDGTPWFVMDYVDEFCRGMRFTAYCRRPEQSVEDQLRLFRTVCEAVLYAHLEGTIHRDLKPSNILIAKDGTPRIVDFGIARRLQASGEANSGIAEQTSPSQRFMSLDYAAPEWKRSGQMGTYTDVYSLGVILYEILTGQHPYRQLSEASGLADEGKPPEKPSTAARRELPRGSLGGSSEKLSRSAWSDLDRLCLKAMHADPLQRYPSVESLIRDIDHYLNNEPLEAQPRMLRYRMGKFVRRNRQAVLATAAALVLIVSMAAFFMWRLANERNLALEEAARVRHIQGFMTDLLQGGDQEAGPAADLRVTAMIGRGVQMAGELKGDPQVQADLYETLGTMSQKLGRLEQADSLLQKALDERQRLAAPDGDANADNLIALGMVRADESKTKDAEQLARQALDEIERHDPGNRILRGKAELALGTVMVDSGAQKDAVPVLHRAVLSLQPQAGGAQLPELARAYATLGDAEIYLCNYDQAESFDRRALAIDKAAYGENHPHIAEDLGDLAQIDEIRGYYAQAEPMERKSLAIMQNWYGPDHPETARKLTTLASTLMYEEKNKEADELLERALAIQERVYGPQSPHVAYALNVIASIELGAKEYQAAERDDSRVEEIYRRAYGDADYRVAVALGNLASVYQDEKRYAKCESLLLNVIGRFTRAVGARNINTGMARARLGMALLEDHKYSASAEQSLAGYQILSKQMNPDSGWILGTRRDLAAAYAALGEPEKARQFRVEPAAATARASR